MSTLTRRDVDHIFQKLREGVVPERGIETFAVGIEAARGEIRRQLELIEGGEGCIKFLRGGYGCGKTFVSRLAVLDAQNTGYATSFVVVSDNDLKFHRFDEVYGRVMTELGTASCPKGALGDILDRWVGRVEDALVDGGLAEDAPDFDAQVRRRLNEELIAHTRGKAPPDFVRVIQAIFDLKQAGEVGEAGALISWLCGSGNVSASAKKSAGIKGEITSRDALAYLHGVLAIIRAAGFKGWLIVIDEAETILRMRSDSRHKSLNGIRQIVDASGQYGGLLWLFTGTKEFFDSRQGVQGLAPLHERIEFKERGGFASLRQPQLQLTPFDTERLRSVALRLRELYPAGDRARLEERISDAFIDHLVAEVTRGFKADVGVVPRQFLREFVGNLDLVDEQPEYDPLKQYGFTPANLRPEEQLAISGAPLTAVDEDDGPVPTQEVW